MLLKMRYIQILKIFKNHCGRGRGGELDIKLRSKNAGKTRVPEE